MLVNLNDILPRARREHYAVGLFNTVSMEMARGVLAAAEETRSPVIIGTAEVLLPAAPLEELSELIIPLAKKATVPVVVHFDHGLTRENVLKALCRGFSSVMYDCSTDSYEENIAKCREMKNIAKMFNATLEAELGHVGTNGTDSGRPEDFYTDPKQARDFVNRTNVDALAVAIGTAHGAYKQKPKLDFNRLSELREATDVPLVLHGGSGLSDDDFRESVRRGIAKINIFTDINVASAKTEYENYKEGFGMTDVIPSMVDAIKQATIRKMELFGSVGRA